MTKDERRKKYIEENGKCCSTCRYNPTNRGQRDSCIFSWSDSKCSERNGYPDYSESDKIYSIDVGYCC